MSGSASFHRAESLWQPHTLQQINVAQVGTEGIKLRVDFEKDDRKRMCSDRFFQPLERFIQAGIAVWPLFLSQSGLQWYSGLTPAVPLYPPTSLRRC